MQARACHCGVVASVPIVLTVSGGDRWPYQLEVCL